MKQRPGVLGWLPALAAMLTGAAGLAEPAAGDESLRARGRALYDVYCARCHGKDGADTTTYAGTKSLVDITQRLTAQEVVIKSMGFAAVALEGEDARALYAHLETFRSGGYARPALLVETSWVALHGNDPDVRIVDLRAAEKYVAGHVPGAVHVEEKLLRNAEDRLTYLPTPETFAALLGRAGIGNDTHVVAYDDAGGRGAARLWYVLATYGHERVSLVNGGWLKWVAERRPVTPEVPEIAPARFTPKLNPTLSCPSPELLARRGEVVVLDARSAEEYRGEKPSPGLTQAGRIPGAVHVNWEENVTGPYQVFRSGPELRRLYESRGVTPDKEIVPY